MKKFVMLSIMAWLTCSVVAGTMVWPEQDAKAWDDPGAIWKTTSGGASAVPGIGDYAYILSTHEVTVNSAIEIKRLYVDRTASTTFPAVASTVTVVSGGKLTVNSIAQFGVDIGGGTLNVTGGEVAFATSDVNRANTWSVRLDAGGTANVNITAGKVTLGSATVANTQVLSMAGSSTVINISGAGLMEMLNGAKFVLDAGASLVQLSDGGLLKYNGVDATGAISALADAGKMIGISPLAVQPYVPVSTSNGVGWYYDGTDTYAFAVPEPATLSLLVLGVAGLLKNRRKA